MSGWPKTLSIKLSLVLLLIVFTVLHDVVIGPRVSRIMQTPGEARRPVDQLLVLSSAWLPRLSLLLAIGVLFAAISFARS